MRRLFRRFFPRLKHPLLDAARPPLGNDVAYAAAYAATIEESDPFVTERFEEGRRWRGVLQHYNPGKRILDLGAGNGAVELAFATEWSVFSVEVAWNDVVRRLRDKTGASLRRVIADAGALPFRDGAFDAVTCLETVEHLRDRRAAAEEIRRVVAHGGLLLVTTPPRLRYLLRPDPHFGIRGLLLLPPALQRAIAARRGFDRPDHYVDRIYTSVGQLRRLFRGFEVLEILSRSRLPRRWFWDAIVFRS
jgi:SAM-dependent methyltransferase